jgi:hypothetical protein
MVRKVSALLCALLMLLASPPAHAGWFSDAYDYWASGRLGEDMLNAVGTSGEDLVYAIDNPDEYAAAVKDEWSSGRAGERVLGYVGTDSKTVAHAIENPDEVSAAVYDEWASGRTGERVFNAVGLTGGEVVFILDNPNVLGGAVHDEWASGRAGGRLILYGQGLYDGGRDILGEGAGLLQDGTAYFYIVSTQENYRDVASAYSPQSQLVGLYKNSEDPGAATAQLLNGLKNLPSQFAHDMANDPRAAGHTVGSFVVPVAIPKGIGATTRALPKVPGFRWTGRQLTLPGRSAACTATTGAAVITDLQAVEAMTGGGVSTSYGLVSTEARVAASSNGTLTLRVATQPKGLRVSGQLLDEFHMYKQGPLGGAEGLAETFSGGKYASVKLSEPTVVYRLHNHGTAVRVWDPIKRAYKTTKGAKETGAFWTLEPPAGTMGFRVEAAVLPEWGNSMSHMATMKLPAGTVIHVGEVGAQRGMFVGGSSQLVIENGVKAALKNGAKLQSVPIP